MAWISRQYGCVSQALGRSATPVGPAAVNERHRRRLVPWLLLAGTLLFAFGNTIRTVAGRSAAATDLRSMSWQVITATCFVELLIAIYGGYFGAGIGLITLGMLAALGMRDINAMGAIRTLLAGCD